MPVIPALRRQRQGGWRVLGQPKLYNETLSQTKQNKTKQYSSNTLRQEDNKTLQKVTHNFELTLS
jgi:hypothetical protein